jgi:hypothetical protein
MTHYVVIQGDMTLTAAQYDREVPGRERSGGMARGALLVAACLCVFAGLEEARAAGVFHAEQFSGADASVQVNSCIAAIIAAGGGTCDAYTVVVSMWPLGAVSAAKRLYAAHGEGKAPIPGATRETLRLNAGINRRSVA